MTPAQLSRTVLNTLRGAVKDGALSVDGGMLPERVVIESPPRRGSGDYGTGVALGLARSAGRTPRELAGLLGRRLEREPGIAGAEVAGAGFLNLTLDAGGRAALLRALTDRAAPPAAEDDPARDVAAWAAATGEAPETLLPRVWSSSLFRVQYAHARARALLRNGRDLGTTPEPGAGGYGYGTPPERALLALLADHERISGAAPTARHGRQARHARHLDAIAGAFFDFHDAGANTDTGANTDAGTTAPLPLGGHKPGAAHRARLALAEATGTVLAGGLSQLGVTSPAHL